MSNSVVKVTELTTNEGLFVLKGKDGVIMPDRETLEAYLSGRKEETEINLICINNSYGNNIEATMEPLIYDPNKSDDVLSEIIPTEMDDTDRTLEQSLLYFRLDHDYTPLGSPNKLSPEQISEETDELAHTLSILEGCSTDTPRQIEEPPTEQTTPQKQVSNVNNLPPTPQELPQINKINKKIEEEKKTQTFSKQLLTSKAQNTVQPVEETGDVESEEEEEVEEEESSESNDDDSDFEPEDTKSVRKSLRQRAKKETEEDLVNEKKKKVVKVQKISPKASKKEPEQPKVLAEKPPVEPQPEQKSPDKKLPKKEKKPPKPIPDDFALFSTPDIIRRVGGKQEIPTTPESPKLSNNFPKPAKIVPESRVKSTSERTSIEGKSKRLSTENKLPTSEKSVNKAKISDDKNKDRRMSLDLKSPHSADRRLSLNIDSKKPQVLPNISSTKTISNKVNTPTVNKNNQVVIQSVDESGGSGSDLEKNSHLEEMPSVEDIRAMIQNEDTKTYSSNLVIPDPSSAAIDQSAINLEASGLDIDPLLENINSDLISEDILYQVAQSLADNTELQNAIDKSLNDGNLVLDPNVQQVIAQTPNITSPQETQQKNTNAVKSTSPNKGTQIVRPDGRVVIIPPIERPTTRSRNRKPTQTPDSLPTTPKSVRKPLDDEHVSGNELDSSGDEKQHEEQEEEEDDDKSDDDPEKLWCICNQPHNNRFMICCDQCEEWYHGKCVNVTKAMGQLMEQEGREWICVYCKDPSLRRPAAAARRIRKASRASTDSGKSQSKTSSTTESSYSPDCIVCGKPSRKNSIFCSDQCILKQAQTVERVVVFERGTGRILSGNNAPSAANLDKWLKEHPGFEVVRSTTNKPVANKALSQSKLKIVKNPSNEGVSLAVLKKGINIAIMQHSPKNQQSQPVILNKHLTKQATLINPHFKIIRQQKSINESRTKLIQPPALSVASPSPKLKQIAPKTTTVVITKPTTPTTPSTSSGTSFIKEKPKIQKTPKARQEDQSVAPPPKQSENIRENVKKTLFEQLTNRLKMANDLKLEPDEITKISNEIESQLYKCFGDTGQKYRNKYRSLIFNIKDVKNQTLWRRICEKSINPYQLVRLSPDDLASQELALWRERENKHQLDMIKKSELELLNCNRQYVLKTHKGEQILEDNRPKDSIDSTEVIATLNSDNISSSESQDSKKDSKDKKNSKHDKERDKGRDKRNRSREKSDNKEKKRDDKSKDHKKRSRSRSRSKSKDRSSRYSEKRKSSRDRDRHHRSHKSSRHKKESSTTEKLDKKSKEILEQLVDKQIVPPLEDRLWKHVPQEDIVTPAAAESDSDHEPSSTVTIPTPPRSAEVEESPSLRPTYTEKLITEKPEKPSTPKVFSSPSIKDERSMSPPPKSSSDYLWKGTINMVDVAQISVTASAVSGDCSGLGEELPTALDVVGRISPETVWDYIGKMKCLNSKVISLIRLSATNMEEKMPYIALYSYLSSRNRLGVIKSLNKAVKDFYILPLASQKPIPQALLPINGPGFEEARPALLLGIIVRDKKKRPTLDAIQPTPPKRTKIEVSVVITPTASTVVTTPARSYTPPPIRNRDPRIKIPPQVAAAVATPENCKESTDDMDEPYSPEDSDPDIVVSPPSLEDTDLASVAPVVKPTFIEAPPTVPTFEPFTSKFDTIPGLEETTELPSSSQELQKKMAELDQKIAMRKAEIDNMSQNIVSTATSDIGTSSLANIALPSNLQQILDSIKGIGASSTTSDNAPVTSVKEAASSNLTMPLLLPKISSRSTAVPPTTSTVSSSKKESTIPLNLPKSKIKSAPINTSVIDLEISPSRRSESEKYQSGVLSSLSEEDLIRKAAEMLGEKKEESKSKTAKITGYQTGSRSSLPYTSGSVRFSPPPTIPESVRFSPPPTIPESVRFSPPPTIPDFTVPPPNVVPLLVKSTSTSAPPAKKAKVDDQPPIPGLEDDI